MPAILTIGNDDRTIIADNEDTSGRSIGLNKLDENRLSDGIVGVCGPHRAAWRLLVGIEPFGTNR